jgi:hypothetical protein
MKMDTLMILSFGLIMFSVIVDKLDAIIKLLQALQ